MIVLTMIMIGAAIVLAAGNDPLVGIGHIMVIAGTNYLGRKYLG